MLMRDIHPFKMSKGPKEGESRDVRVGSARRVTDMEFARFAEDGVPEEDQ